MTRGTGRRHGGAQRNTGGARPDDDQRAAGRGGRDRRGFGRALARDAYALTASSFASAGIGLVCYVLAARLFPQGIVGRAVGITSAMILLSGIASLDLATVLQRFLPAAGPTGGRLIAGCYAAMTAASFLVTIPFVLLFGRPLFGPDRLGDGVLFSLAVAAWSIFSLQDVVLLGLGRAPLIPLENLLFGLGRLALLVGLAGGGVTALVASWILPMILLVLLVNAVVVVWIYPDYRHRAPITGTPWNLAEIVRFAAASYFARLCTAAAANALPLMVIAYLGDATNASFYMAWTIGLTLEMVVINFSSSLLVQGAQNPAHIPALARVAFRQQAMVLVPAVAVVVVFAREILVVFGEKYADDATTLLRLVALGILPTIGTYLYIPIARLRGRVVEVTLLTALASGGFLALAWFGLRQHGLAGLGVAYLLAQGGLGVLLLPRVFRILTGSAGAPGTASSPADSGSGHLATATAPSTEPPAAADLGLSHQTGGSDRNTASGLGRYRRAQVGRHRARSSDA